MEQLKTIGRELAMGSQGSSKEFLDLVRSIGEAKSKAEEERIVTAEIENLKKRIGEPDVPRKKMKEYIIRLVYVEMLGHDASFGYIHAVKMTHDDNLLLKRTGYLAVTLFLNEDHDLIILIVNTIQKDLRSDNYLVCCAALTAVCKLINEETIPAVLPQIVELLAHPKELVRKKAVMAFHRFYQRSPTSVSHLLPFFQEKLCDRDPSVMGAVVCAFFDMITADAKPFKHLVASLVSILKQAVEHRFPKAYDYHRTPAPFIQIKLLKILALLGCGDKIASENMYSVLVDILKRSDPTINIGNAILYECVCTLTAIHPNPKLLQQAAEITSKFLKSEIHNSRYMGIDALGRLIKVLPECAEDHQLAVIDCLEDPDDTLKRKTLDLLYKMTKASNVEVIIERMIDYIRTINDNHYKADISFRVIELAERYAPSNKWFIQTMNQIFELAGDLVPSKIAHDLMRLIAEGAGEEDEDADSQLRSSAVESYLHLLGEPKLPSILLQVICWVLGEYGTADGSHSAEYIIGKLCDVASSHASDDTVKGYAITAIIKLCAFQKAAGRRVELIPECQSFIEELSTSHSTDLQQRAYEFQALLSLDADLVTNVMPIDASCEDIEVDKNLSFLNGFVESALAKGARVYMSDYERESIGTTLVTGQEKNMSSQMLRFEAYEKPQAPDRLGNIIQKTDYVQQTIPEYVGQAVSALPDSDIRSDSAKLRLDGVQKKWGRATYATPSSSQPSAGPVAKSTANPPNNGITSGDVYVGGSSGRESAADARKKPTPAISPEKQKLAASLFGGLPSKSSGRVVKPTHQTHQSSRPSTNGLSDVNKTDRKAKNIPIEAPDLLDLGQGDAVTTVADPFKQLENLLDVSSMPVETVTPSTPSVDLLSLYDATPSAALVDSEYVKLQTSTAADSSVPMGLNFSGLSEDVGKTNSIAKKGPSIEDSLQKHAISRQVGVTPTMVNPDLFKDLLG